MSRRTREAAQQAAAQATAAATESQQSVENVEIPQFVPEPEPEKPRQQKRESKKDSDGDEPVVTIRRNEPRRRALEELENRHNKAKGIEPEPEPEPKAEVKPEIEAKTESESAVEPAVEPAAEVAEPVAEPVVEAPKLVRVKVDGEEFDVPEEEIEAAGGVKAYQKDKAAENRLVKANQALAETRQLQAAIAQHTQRTVAPQQPQPTLDQFIASKMEKLRFGTEEEFAAAMREILQIQRVDVNAITHNAVMTMQKNMAVDNFKKEFQDVVSNPLLLRLASTLENERVAKLGPQPDWNSFYRSIGNEVRSVTGRQSQTPATTPKSTTSDPISQSPSEKEARKASIVNIPTAAARASVAETKPETREDILNSMRKSRGLPVG